MMNGEPGLFDTEDYDTAEVDPSARYAFHRRKRIMMDLYTVPDHLLPTRCQVPHYCVVDLDALAEQEMERKRLDALLDPQ